MPRERTVPIERVIDDLEALKAISDPLRLRILDLTSTDPSRAWTAKELAAALGTSQTKLYHHLALMQEHGFLRVAETRLVSGIQEKRYAATAHGFHVDRGLLAGSAGETALAHTLDVLFDKARGEIVASLHAGLIDPAESDARQRRISLSASRVRLSPTGVRTVMRMVERLSALDTLDDPDGEPFGLLVAFYPRADGDPDR